MRHWPWHPVPSTKRLDLIHLKVIAFELIVVVFMHFAPERVNNTVRVEAGRQLQQLPKKSE